MSVRGESVLVSRREAARRLGVSPATLRKMQARHEREDLVLGVPHVLGVHDAPSLVRYHTRQIELIARVMCCHDRMCEIEADEEYRAMCEPEPRAKR